MTLHSEPFDSDDLFSSICRIAAGRAEKKALLFLCTLASDVPDQLLGDSGRLTQVLLNLIDNAIKFTAQGKISLSVDVESKEADSVRLKICVADSGIGIKKEHQPLIFKAFEQGDGSTTRKFGGTGLGLSIVSHLVELMGGRIWVESEPGCGAKFYITPQFKMTPQRSDAAAKSERSRPDAPVGPLVILLAEDNPVNQMLAVRLLEKSGHQVTVVGNGQEAIDALNDRKFDVILMDIQMPEVDGITATKQIRDSERSGQERVPIIAMTAHALDGDRARCIRAGMDGYLSKPINSAALTKVLADVLAATRASAVPPGFSPLPAKDGPSSQPAVN